MTKKLATIEDSPFAIMKSENSEAMEAVNDNLRGAQLNRFDLVKIKVPSGGPTEWTIEEADGNKLAPTFEGIILYWHDARAYYEDPNSQSDDPPDCASEDAITGNAFGSCADCQYSKWESDPKGGKGQACRLKRVLYVLQPDSYLPVVVEAPPTSYGAVKKYFISLSKDGVSSSGIVTQFGLMAGKSGSGHDYAIIVPKSMRVLSAEEREFVKQYSSTFKQSLSI